MRALILVILVFSSGCSVQRLAWDKGDKIALGALLACQAADVASTAYGLSAGYSEANPFLPDNAAGIAAVKIGVTGAIAGAAHLMPSHAGRRAVLGVGAITGCLPAAYNIGTFASD